MVYKLKLIKKKEIARDTIALYFEKPRGFSYTAGQSMRLTFKDINESKTFSIANAPHEDELVFAVRLTGSDFKKKLEALSVGSTVEAEGPFGSRFVLQSDTTRPIVFIAGGIGITPLLSMLSHVVHENLGHNITLFYSNRKMEDASFLKDLHEITEKRDSFTFVPTLTKEKADVEWEGEVGYISPEMIKKHTKHTAIPLFYIAGPPDMVMGMKKVLEDSGVRSEDIITKKFTGYEQGNARA